MLIKSSAPARLSLIGGGSDMHEFSSQHSGAVLSLTINLRTHIELLTGSDMSRIPASKFPNNCDPKLCYKILHEYLYEEGEDVKLISTFDGIVGAGLGSSGSFSVALIAALEKRKGNVLTPYMLAEKAYNIEVNKYGKYGGRQDHYAASFGGFNHILFENEAIVFRESHKLIDFLYPYLCLFYIGNKRTQDIQKKYQHLTDDQIQNLILIRDLVSKAYRDIVNKKIDKFAETMRVYWSLKKDSGGVTNKAIDEIYDKGLAAGALAGKLLGAGEDGYFLFVVDPKYRKDLMKEMSKMGVVNIDFEPDWQGAEARIC